MLNWLQTSNHMVGLSGMVSLQCESSLQHKLKFGPGPTMNDGDIAITWEILRFQKLCLRKLGQRQDKFFIVKLILSIHCWVLFANILLRIFMSMFTWDSSPFLLCFICYPNVVSLSAFWYQGNNTVFKMSWEMFPLSSFLERFFYKIGIIH